MDTYRCHVAALPSQTRGWGIVWGGARNPRINPGPGQGLTEGREGGVLRRHYTKTPTVVGVVFLIDISVVWTESWGRHRLRDAFFHRVGSETYWYTMTPHPRSWSRSAYRRCSGPPSVCQRDPGYRGSAWTTPGKSVGKGPHNTQVILRNHWASVRWARMSGRWPAVVTLALVLV